MCKLSELTESEFTNEELSDCLILKQDSGAENPAFLLGAVSGSTLIDKEFENLWNGKELKPRYYDGDKNWDNDNNVKIAFEILWGK